MNIIARILGMFCCPVPPDEQLARGYDEARGYNLPPDQRPVVTAVPETVSEHQVWERRLPGTPITEQTLFLAIDAEGRARVHEAILVTLLRDAGWERTA